MQHPAFRRCCFLCNESYTWDWELWSYTKKTCSVGPVFTKGLQSPNGCHEVKQSEHAVGVRSGVDNSWHNCHRSPGEIWFLGPTCLQKISATERYKRRILNARMFNLQNQTCAFPVRFLKEMTRESMSIGFVSEMHWLWLTIPILACYFIFVYARTLLWTYCEPRMHSAKLKLRLERQQKMAAILFLFCSSIFHQFLSFCFSPTQGNGKREETPCGDVPHSDCPTVCACEESWRLQRQCIYVVLAAVLLISGLLHHLQN